MYVIKAYNIPFNKEWHIYNDWVSFDKEKLIELVRVDLEDEILMEKVKLTIDEDGYLLINGKTERWLKIHKLINV